MQFHFISMQKLASKAGYWRTLEWRDDSRHGCFSFHHHWEHHDPVSQHPLQPQSHCSGAFFLLALGSSGSLLPAALDFFADTVGPVIPDASGEGAEEGSSTGQVVLWAPKTTFTPWSDQYFKSPLSHNLLKSYKISRTPADAVTEEYPGVGDR